MAAAEKINQRIKQVEISEGTYWTVGCNCTHIEEVARNGEYAEIPYIRVWKENTCLAEHNMHKLLGIYYATGE